ncbi:MAG TPA: type I glyceraldehyde-3-phosphate dehydrogenase [Chloroflexota bacterium]|nr:type I glyceraldehyde-3-phosphate dehydrogenase [Chloroflexota bacterium]
MAVKVGINGLGRIGSLVLRAGLDYPDLQFVAVNDLTDPETLAYLFEFNSVHGAFDGSVEVRNSTLVVDGEQVQIFHEKDPSRIPWKDAGVELVIESTGIFESLQAASKHLQAGASRVIITAPAKDVPTTLVMGVNHQVYDPGRDQVVAMGSCTTYALAPVVKVLQERFGIVKGLVNTTHAYTNTQALLDRAIGGNPRRSRAAPLNIVPTTTGAVRAVGKVIPAVDGKIEGLAVRVPVPDGSLLDFTCVLEHDVTTEEVNQAFREAARSEELAPYMAVIDIPIVSSDIIGVDQSSVIDATLTMTSGNLAKVFSWYDNEWSFALRVCDLASYMGSKVPVQAGQSATEGE